MLSLEEASWPTTAEGPSEKYAIKVDSKPAERRTIVLVDVNVVEVVFCLDVEFDPAAEGVVGNGLPRGRVVCFSDIAPSCFVCLMISMNKSHSGLASWAT